MADQKKHDQRLRDLASTALEAARIEVVRRMQAGKRPLSIEIQQLAIVDNPEGGGWRSDLMAERVSGLHGEDALWAIGDRSVPNQVLGLRAQLAPLAEYLIAETDLATRRFGGLLSEDQIDELLFRCLSPLALYYLRSLSDLGASDPKLIERLTVELEGMITDDVIRSAHHLAAAGIRPTSSFTHRGVSIRSLSPRERGAWAEQKLPMRSGRFIPGSDFMPTAPFPNFMPSALLELTTTRSIEQQFDSSRLPSRVALAFFLHGYDLSASGIITHFDQPSWASFGRNNTPFPVSEKMVVDDKAISSSEFAAIVDLACKMPDFGAAEATGREVVLFRVLRGCGLHWQDSGFLDFSIALEAALLGKPTTELAFKFSLYGALFLRDAYNAYETFERLKNIYQVRSKLVHGGSVGTEARGNANRDARELAKAVTLKAIESGWPNAKMLESFALGG